jgi:hypothetical protein
VLVAEGVGEGEKLRRIARDVKRNVHSMHHLNQFRGVLALKISQMH